MTQEVALSLAWNALNTLVLAVFVSAAWRERRTRRARGTEQPEASSPAVLDHDRTARNHSVGVAS
jgi:hypothetical protein